MNENALAVIEVLRDAPLRIRILSSIIYILDPKMWFERSIKPSLDLK